MNRNRIQTNSPLGTLLKFGFLAVLSCTGSIATSCPGELQLTGSP